MVGVPGCEPKLSCWRSSLRFARTPPSIWPASSAFEGLERVDRRSPTDVTEPRGDRLHDFLSRVRRAILTARDRGLLGDQTVVSAGGSAAFDLVVNYFKGLTGELILRSGCYVIHDHGLYAAQSPLQAGIRADVEENELLTPALTVWAHVVSRPEDGAAVAGLGRRDAGHDAGMPTPLARVPARGAREPLAGWTSTRMWDQHTLLHGGDGATPLAVGDVLTFGVSHPCTTFDKWRSIVELDDQDTVVGLLETWF